MTDAHLRARAMSLWSTKKHDTADIARLLHVAEWRVYNALAVSKGQVLIEDKPRKPPKRQRILTRTPIITADGFLIFSRRAN